MKVLITGIAGFIGSRLAEALIGHGHEVSGIDNLSTGRLANVPAAATFAEDDVRAYVPVGRWDVIYHCAASYRDRAAWEADVSTNVMGTINVVREAQRSGARIVYFQTSLCYGTDPVSPAPIDAPLAPVGSYAVSKTAGEAFIRDSGVPYVSLRLANIYGPRNLSGPIPTFYQKITAGESCTVVDSRRDFVFIDDLVWLAVAAATKGAGAYNVASGTDYSIENVWQQVVQTLGVTAHRTLMPRGPDDVATLLLDPSATEAAFGWTARTTLAEGIAAAVGWYDAHPVTETFTHLAGVR